MFSFRDTRRTRNRRSAGAVSCCRYSKIAACHCTATPLSRTKTFDESGSPTRMSLAATATATRRASGHEPNFRDPRCASEERKKARNDGQAERRCFSRAGKERGTRARPTSARDVFATEPAARVFYIKLRANARGQLSYCAKRTP